VVTDFSPAFLGMFESLRMGPTFARGRRDEKAGHVRSLTVSGSLVVALVRGPDDPAAFRARIAVRAFGASEWARVESALVAEARFVADLLDGRMPPGIEEVFAGAGLSPLPLSLTEVAMDCTCERWPMPCAHLAATCYALARAFESDPFEVFTWRGRPRDELLMRLRRLREAAAVDGSGFDGSPSSSGRADPSSGRAGSSGSGGADDIHDDGASARSGSAGAPVGSGAGGRAPDSGSASASSHPAADPASFWGASPPISGRGNEERGPGRAFRGEPPGSATAGPGSAATPGPGSAATPGPGSAGADGSTGGAPGRGTGLRPDALLDQLDAPGLSHQGKPVTEVLRVAYQALPDAENPA
jgi:uncharacterized Zn finger protein